MYKEKLDTEIRKVDVTYTDAQERQDEIDYLTRQYEEKIEHIQTIFERTHSKHEQREVPEYLIDPISFNLFVDPVIARSGQSFERSWILQHLKGSSTDPFSRQPMTKDDLISNIQLKAAAEVSKMDNKYI